MCLERVRRTEPGLNGQTGSCSERADFHGPTLAERTRNTRRAQFERYIFSLSVRSSTKTAGRFRPGPVLMF